MSTYDLSSEFNSGTFGFDVDFSSFITLYRGVERVYIDSQGILHAEMVDGSIQDLGLVSDYTYAVSAGYEGSMADWVNLLLDAHTEAINAAASAADALSYKNSALSAKNAAATSATNAEASKTAAQQAKTAAETAQSKAETAITHYPRIKNNDNWETWDATNEVWVDTGHKSMAEATISYDYQNSTSGSVVPTGAWVQIPAPEAGKFMWSRMIYTWNNGSVDYFYNVSYIGTNGEGSVNSVNGLGGDVILDGRNIYLNNDNRVLGTIYENFATITNEQIDTLFPAQT